MSLKNQNFFARVVLVSHSCHTLVTSVAPLLHSCRSCRTRVARVWHSCCKLDYIVKTSREIYSKPILNTPLGDI